MRFQGIEKATAGRFLMREQDSRSYPVHEDMPLQYAFWTVERALWVALAAILLLALTGVFAHGPLSNQTVSDTGLSLTYERFQRVTATSRLSATISAPDANGTVLTLSPSFSQHFEITDIEPRPQRSSAGPRGLELGFLPPAMGELSVVIWARPHAFGVFDLSAAAEPQGRVTFSILVYP
jgi:hypothetical protein